MALEPLGQREGVVDVALHAQRQRLQALQQQERVERRERPADRPQRRRNPAPGRPQLAIARLLRQFAHLGADLEDALPVGVLDHRHHQAARRIRGKAGSMAYTYALAGYAVTAADERLAFAIMLNNYHRPANAGRPTAELDAIAIMLAELSVLSTP